MHTLYIKILCTIIFFFKFISLEINPSLERSERERGGGGYDETKSVSAILTQTVYMVVPINVK